MISFQRSNKWVSLNTFMSKGVADYLKKVLNENSEQTRFEIKASSKWSKSILANIDGTSFMIYADNNTYIELSFNVSDLEKMSDVIEALKSWDRFSKTECKHIFDYEDGETHTTIFENGYASVKDYKMSFEKYGLSVTKF